VFEIVCIVRTHAMKVECNFDCLPMVSERNLMTKVASLTSERLNRLLASLKGIRYFVCCCCAQHRLHLGYITFIFVLIIWMGSHTKKDYDV